MEDRAAGKSWDSESAKYLASRATAPADAALFVTAAGRPNSHRAVTRAVRRAARRLGIHVHPHMFRHSYATELLERGSDIRDIRDLPVATTEIYTHVSAARRRRVVQLLDAPGDIRLLLSPPRENSNRRHGDGDDVRMRAGEGL